MAHSYAATSSPVRRGAWVLEQMLCEELNPPPDVDMEIPPPENENQTIRDRLAIHSENPACQGCHQKELTPSVFPLSIMVLSENIEKIGKMEFQ